MAVNRRALARADISKDNCHSITTPGYRDGKWRFRQSANGRIQWLDPLPAPDALALVETILSKVTIDPAQNWSLCLDTQVFVASDGVRKYGLGASAAISVALAAVLGRMAGVNETAVELAYESHRDFQSGRGSGVDIAASLHGGVIEYYRSLPNGIRRLEWPDGLHCAFFWSGRAASTPEKLRELHEKPEAAASRDTLRQRARQTLDAWRVGDASKVLVALRDYTRALRQFDVDHSLGIFDAGLAALSDLAESLGLIFKPCGAGGGDIGALFAANRAAAAGFVRSASRQGFETLDVTLDNTGVTCTV
jgi:phosphomevalonate kinase